MAAGESKPPDSNAEFDVQDYSELMKTIVVCAMSHRKILNNIKEKQDEENIHDEALKDSAENVRTAWGCLKDGWNKMEDIFKANFQHTTRHQEIMNVPSFHVIDDKDTRILKLELELDEVKSQLQKAQSELRLIKEMSEHRGIVQILCERRGPVIDDVYRDFISLISGFAKENRILVKQLRNPCDVYTDIPLLVVCYFSSRVGADAKAAIKGLKDFNKSMLLVFYPADCTSRYIPSAQLLIDSEFRQLDGITDFIYASLKTISPGKENDKSLKNVKDFISRHCIDHSRSKYSFSFPSFFKSTN